MPRELPIGARTEGGGTPRKLSGPCLRPRKSSVTMLTTFTHLAYAFCAAVLSHGTGDLVVVGYVSLDRC
jgi:hypothetical protein